MDFDYEDFMTTSGLRQNLGNNRAAWAVQQLFAPVKRISKQLSDIYALWGEGSHMPIERLSSELRLAGGRAAGIFTPVLNAVAGRNLGVAGPPGTVLHLGAETPTTASSKKEAMKAGFAKQRRLSPTGDY
jgi:hypothetical protein